MATSSLNFGHTWSQVTDFERPTFVSLLNGPHNVPLPIVYGFSDGAKIQVDN